MKMEMTMALDEKRLYCEALKAAMAFFDLRPWEEYEFDDCLALKVPGEPYPLFASVMGQMGEEFGIMLVRGEHACRDMWRMINREDGYTSLMDEIRVMSFSMTPLGMIPPDHLGFLDKAGAFCPPDALAPDALAPYVLAKDRGRIARELADDEVMTMLYILNGIIKAHRLELYDPEPFYPKEDVLTLNLTGDPLDPEVSIEFLLYPDTSPPPVTFLPENQAALKKLEKLKETWCVGYWVLPVSVQDDDRTTRILTVFKKDSLEIIKAEPSLGWNLIETAQTLFSIFEGKNYFGIKGIAHKLVFDNEALFDMVSPAISRLGVTCSFEPDLPVMRSVYHEMTSSLGPEGVPGELEGELFGRDGQEEIDPEFMPAPDDLEGWKTIDMILTQKMAKEIFTQKPPSTRIFSRYFGDLDSADYQMHDSGNEMVMECFSEWFSFHYRATKKSKTLVEKMPAKSLTPALRMALESRAKAHPSIYKIQSIKPGVSLTFRDIILGGVFEVHDKSMSETSTTAMAVPLKIYPAGNFYLAMIFGPPLSLLQAPEAVDFLVGLGLELSAKGLDKNSHLFGRLWDWMENITENDMPLMQNTDGEELNFNTATYKVTNKNKAKKALGGRKDIDLDPASKEYTWFRKKDAGSKTSGGVIVIGTLSFEGKHLVLEVNSKERLDKARAWLDTVPGIRFKNVLARTPKEMMDSSERPDESRTGGGEMESSPEADAETQKMLNEYYMDWIDRPLPVFNGKTPRQMCRTGEGRSRVAIMIRAIPVPAGETNLVVPCREMLKELGLDE